MRPLPRRSSRARKVVKRHDKAPVYPMKKAGGKFERISWDQAIGEIAERLKKILQEHGPRSLASVTGGGGFNFYPLRFLVLFIEALGSRYQYSSANQEFAGRYWAHGLTLGSQMLDLSPDYVNSEVMMTVGWNGMMSHHIPQARRVLTRISKDPDKLLVVLKRADQPGGVKVKDIEAALRQELFAQVQDDSPDALRSLNRGLPVTLRYPRSPASQAIRRLAKAACGARAKR